jgi:hypothetical protein
MGALVSLYLNSYPFFVESSVVILVVFCFLFIALICAFSFLMQSPDECVIYYNKHETRRLQLEQLCIKLIKFIKSTIYSYIYSLICSVDLVDCRKATIETSKLNIFSFFKRNISFCFIIKFFNYPFHFEYVGGSNLFFAHSDLSQDFIILLFDFGFMWII